MTTDVERFAALFEGRPDAFGSESGGCLRPYETHLELIDAHLRGVTPIGVYPMVPLFEWPPSPPALIGWRVKWGCVDLDVKHEGKRRYDYETSADAMAAAKDLVAALHLLGITGWIERTRSGGFHVWVFAEKWVPAATMRRALFVACQVAEVPPTEVNPKAEGFDSPETLGNYVRLPYPGALSAWYCDAVGACGPSSETRVVIFPDDPRNFLSLPKFLVDAEASLATRDTLEQAAALFKEPPRSAVSGTGEKVELSKELTNKLSGKTWLKLKDGPLDELPDRSQWLFTLALDCAEDGLTEDEAIAVVTEADERHCHKYVDRRDGEAQIERTVLRAFQ